MRWANNQFRWVRPLHSVVLLFDGKVTNRSQFELDATQNAKRESIKLGNETRGHRFLAPGQITVTSFADYQSKLRAAKVILDPAERRAAIWHQAEALAAKEGLIVKSDDA